MRYVAFVVTQGEMPAEAIAEMNRDWPAYAERMKRRGGLRLGRELDLPETGVTTVRVRRGEVLATDGPFLETKEFVAGVEVFESADLAEAIRVESMNPVARFNPFEIRPLPDTFRVGPKVTAFGDGDDSEGIPYLLSVWADQASAASLANPELSRECAAWRSSLEESGLFILGGPLEAPETARTLRPLGGEIQVSDGPFLDTAELIAAIEVVRSPDHDQAVALAASHPLARQLAIEVRSFYTETE